jgi:predicted GNAT family acetyltransferase
MSNPIHAILDNPVYAALSGAQSRFAQRSGQALRYQPDVAPFMAMPPSPSDADWRDAAELVPPGTAAAILGVDTSLPGTWTLMRSFEVAQMTGENASGADEPEAIELGLDDVPEILELTGLTNPGPFLERTIELGDYLGIRSEGALIAMAGERMRLDGWTEISAVCTAPTHQGQGLASRLIFAVTQAIQDRNEMPFLHVLSSNVSAIRLYEKLGFRIRKTAMISVVAPAA